MASASPLIATFYGHIASTQDALILFEACLSGALNHVARRPHDRERASLIKSGNVFIYEEHSSGIKRWTDGVPWSPSRILGNFLVYRELERPFPPGEKKRAMKRSKRSPGITKQEPYGSSSSTVSTGYSPASAIAPGFDSGSASSLSKETERSLIGSLVDSYGFKDEGLVKKTVSVTVGGVSHHLVSYYTVADVMNNKFSTPSKDPRFQQISPRPDLVTKQNFRTPIDEVDSIDRMDDRTVYPNYPYPRSNYEMTNQSISHRTMSLPIPSPLPYASSSLYGGYNMTPSSGSYETLGPGQSSQAYSSFPPTPAMYQAPPKSENYELGYRQQQRYNSHVGLSPDATRGQIPSLTTQNYTRRSSNFEQGSSSIDSGLSNMSAATSTDSKLATDSGFTSQTYYGGIRDTNASHNYPTQQRSLPTPSHQVAYDRPSAHHPYTPVDNPGVKELWTMGNTSSGHGHYMAAQQQWASTGSS